jgi:hypothetical protein
MSRFISSLQSFTNHSYGEKSHLQYGWSNNLDEKICQFFFQLVRNKDHTNLEKIHNDILSQLSVKIIQSKSKTLCVEKEVAVEKLNIMYKLIGQTRDIISGKGEQQLAFMQIFGWYKWFPELAINAFTHFVYIENTHPYGSWKDVKYFCNYVFAKTKDKNHALIEHACRLMILQLDIDWYNYNTKSTTFVSNKTSLAARWCPREPNYKKKKNVKFGWLFKKIAIYYQKSNSQMNNEIATRRMLRKRLSILNKSLDTTQIFQAGKQWSKINFNSVTSKTMRNQKFAFQNKTKRSTTRSSEEDRINCAKKFVNHINKAIKNPDTTKVHGKRCNVYELVKDAIMIPLHNKDDCKTSIDTINLQWKDNLKNNRALGHIPIVPMADVSPSMECDECIPLYNSIGLSIRCSELTHPVFRNKVMTFDENPQWVDMDGTESFYEKAHRVKSASWGGGTKIFRAFEMVLHACVQNKVPSREVENMIIAIFSDMQIDCHYVKDSPFNDKVMVDRIDEMYQKEGYKTPHLLFWNLRKTSGFPMLTSRKNCTALSGYSSTLLNVFCDKGIGGLKEFTPQKMLEDLLSHNRYDIMEQDLRSHLINY